MELVVYFADSGARHQTRQEKTEIKHKCHFNPVVPELSGMSPLVGMDPLRAGCQKKFGDVSFEL